MKKPPNSRHSTASAIYRINRHTRDLEISIAELQLSSYQYDLLIQLIEDIPEWNEKTQSWTPSTDIFFDSLDACESEEYDPHHLGRLYQECQRRGLDQDNLALIDRAHQRIESKKKQLMLRTSLFVIPEWLFVLFYATFFWLVQMAITVGIWIGIIYGIHWWFFK